MNDSKIRASTAKVVLRPIESHKTKKRYKPATSGGKYRMVMTNSIKRDKLNQLSTPSTINMKKKNEIYRSKTNVPVANVNACFNSLIRTSKKEKKKVKKHNNTLKRVSAPQHLFPNPQTSSLGFDHHDHMINFAKQSKDSPLVKEKKNELGTLINKYGEYDKETFTKEIYKESKNIKGGKPPLLEQMESIIKKELKKLKQEQSEMMEQPSTLQQLINGINSPAMSDMDMPTIMRDDRGHRLSADPTTHIEAVRTNLPISQYDIQRLQIFREVFHALKADFKTFGPLFHKIQTTYEQTCKLLGELIVKIKNEVPLNNHQSREVAIAGHHLKTYQQTQTEQEESMNIDLKQNVQSYDHKLFSYRKHIQDLEEKKLNLEEALRKKRESGNVFMFDLHDQIEGENIRLKDQLRENNTVVANTEAIRKKIERIQGDIAASKDNIIDPELISRQQLLKEQYLKRVSQYEEQLNHFRIANRQLHRTIKKLTSVTISSENVNEKLTIFERSLSPRPQWDTLKTTYEGVFDFLPDDNMRAEEEKEAIKQGLSILDISDYTKPANSTLTSSRTDVPDQVEEVLPVEVDESIVSQEEDDEEEGFVNPTIEIKNPSSKPILNIDTPVSLAGEDSFDQEVSLDTTIPPLDFQSLTSPDERVSTQKSVDILLKYVMLASERIKANNKEIEENASKLAFLNSEEFEAERNERKYFYGLGMSENIPKYMRYTGRLRRKNIGKRECELLLEDFWEKRRAERATASSPQAVSSFEDFLVEFFKKSKSVIRAVYMEWIYNVLDACERFIDDADCELFLRILRGEICELTYYDQFSMLESLHYYLTHGGHTSKSHKKEKKVITRKKLIKLCKSFFKAKSIDRMREIEREIKHSVKSKKVNVEMLFEETRDKNQSPFVECIRDQYCQEIIEFGDDITSSLDMHSVDSLLTIENIRKAFYHVDPSCKVKEVDKMIVTTLESLGKYDIEPLDPNMSIDADTFTNQLKKSCLLKRCTKLSDVEKVKKKHLHKQQKHKRPKKNKSETKETTSAAESLDSLQVAPSPKNVSKPKTPKDSFQASSQLSVAVHEHDFVSNDSQLSSDGLKTPQFGRAEFNETTQIKHSSSISMSSSSTLHRSLMKKQIQTTIQSTTYTESSFEHSSSITTTRQSQFESFPPLRVALPDEELIEETPLPVPRTSIMF